MINQELFFIICSFFAVLSALLIYLNKNPIYSVIYLIFTFIFSSCTLITIGEDFLGVILIIIYVGAITVLLLFIIMTLNIKKFNFFPNKKNIFFNFTKVLFFIGIWLSLFRSLYITIYTEGTIDKLLILNRMDLDINQYPVLPGSLDNPEFPFVILRNVSDSIMPIGQYLYVEFIILFLLSAMILLIAMLGSIIIAQQEKTMFKKQNASEQINKKYSQCITLLPKK
jgi:NADH-quinone oxidoreductase subunit J